MRLVVYGGSFNPVHIGHLILAEEALEELGADLCAFVPAFRAPHKGKPAGAGDQDRLDMLRASTAGESRFIVEGCEIERGGVSYTCITLEEISLRYRLGEKPFLLLGDDLAPGFASWREPGRIASMADIVLARRTAEGCREFPWPHARLGNRLIDISSSDIRGKLSRGVSCRQSLPEGAFRIIRERGLYGYRRGKDGEAVAPRTGSR